MVSRAWPILILVFFFPATGHAYIDPGAGPILWQLLVLFFTGLVFGFRRFFARLWQLVRRGKRQAGKSAAPRDAVKRSARHRDTGT